MNDLATLIVENLRRMDDEAMNWSYFGGVDYPTGLRLYGDHVKPNRDPHPSRARCKPREDVAARRLMELIEWTYQAHPKYPDGLLGDLLIDLPTGKRAWLELKWVYAYEYTHERVKQCGSYRKYLLSMSDGEHSVSRDFVKLEQVTAERADFVAVVMLGFDDEAWYPISAADMSELKQNANYDRHDWHEVYASWAERHVLQDTDWYAADPRFRVRCWVWWRSTEMTADLVTARKTSSRVGSTVVS